MQWMLGSDFVVTVSDHEQRSGSMNASAEELEQVERRIVRPVNVFEHDERALSLRLVERGGEDDVPARSGRQRCLQSAFCLPTDVVKRRQGARREESIARAIRSFSPTAQPNIRLVSLADDILGRGGRMTNAIRAIGPGRAAYEGHPFRLDLE